MPLKQPEKSPLPPIFQGLSDLSKAPHEVPLSGCCRKWIKDTDSAYVRLAKQGGQRDLLKHYTPVVMQSPPAAYAAPDWYLHHTNSPAMHEPRSQFSSLPEYMIHREFKADDHCGKSYEARRGPFDFDTKSVWQQDAEDKENAEKKKEVSILSSKTTLIKSPPSETAEQALANSLHFSFFHHISCKRCIPKHRRHISKVKLPAINPKYPSRMPNVSTNKEFSGANKLSFPPMPAQRESEAVNFSKLISNGYGTDGIQQCTGWDKKIQETSENSQQSKDLEQSQSEAPPARNELKPPFQGCNK